MDFPASLSGWGALHLPSAFRFRCPVIFTLVAPVRAKHWYRHFRRHWQWCRVGRHARLASTPMHDWAGICRKHFVLALAGIIARIPSVVAGWAGMWRERLALSPRQSNDAGGGASRFFVINVVMRQVVLRVPRCVVVFFVLTLIAHAGDWSSRRVGRWTLYSATAYTAKLFSLAFAWVAARSTSLDRALTLSCSMRS